MVTVQERVKTRQGVQPKDPKDPSILRVFMDCGHALDAPAETDSEGGTITFDGDPGSRGGGVCGHELGHVLFGTGKQKPDGWDENSHPPEPEGLTGFMRDTGNPRGSGAMTRDEEMTTKERCWLADKAGLTIEACCFGYLDVPRANAVAGAGVLRAGS